MQASNTALHIAAKKGHMESITALLDLKADIEAVNQVSVGGVPETISTLYACKEMSFCMMALTMRLMNGIRSLE